MVNGIQPATGAFRLPDKLFMDSASSSLFGTVYQDNVSQYATLETAKALASMLGGEVVDLKDQWRGGSETSQYAIQMPGGGPVLNAGLIASRCQSCGVEYGLSAALQEVGAMTGRPVAFADAWNQIVAKESALAAAAAPASATKPSVTTDAAAAQAAISAPAAEQPKAAEVAEQAKIADATKQFEALLIGQLLKSAREQSSGGWLGSGEGDAGISAVELAESQLAQSISASGGLGLSELILHSLTRKQPD